MLPRTRGAEGLIDARRIGPTAPPRVSVGDGRRPKRDASTLLSVAAGLLFVLLWSASRIATGIVVQADEGSYLLNAAAIAGKLVDVRKLEQADA